MHNPHCKVIRDSAVETHTGMQALLFRVGKRKGYRYGCCMAGPKPAFDTRQGVVSQGVEVSLAVTRCVARLEAASYLNAGTVRQPSRHTTCCRAAVQKAAIAP